MVVDPLAVMQGVSMVAGWFGSSRAKRRERKKIGRLKGFAATAQRDYQGAAENIDKRYKKLGGMMREGYDQQNLLDAVNNNATRSDFMQEVGNSNLANVAKSQETEMEQQFAMQQNQRGLEREGAAFDLQRQAEGEYRDVKQGLLGLQRDAAQSGFTLKKSKFNLQSYLDRRYI